jgi:phage shock protein PspC (stress-responsive transcriptional regulator)
MNFKGRKLYRSRNDRLILGVCDGLGEYFEVNSNIVRFMFLISNFFLSGIVILIYFILSGLIPEENQVLKESDKISKIKATGFFGLIDVLNKLNQQALIKNQNKAEPNELTRNIYSQEMKNKYSQSSRVELDGYETRSGISFDWRGKLMIVLIILSVGYFLWKFGLLNFLNI